MISECVLTTHVPLFSVLCCTNVNAGGGIGDKFFNAVLNRTNISTNFSKPQPDNQTNKTNDHTLATPRFRRIPPSESDDSFRN